MKKITFIIGGILLLQSCCVYHETKKVGNNKISEIGIAKHSERPISRIAKR